MYYSITDHNKSIVWCHTSFVSVLNRLRIVEYTKEYKQCLKRFKINKCMGYSANAASCAASNYNPIVPFRLHPYGT